MSAHPSYIAVQKRYKSLPEHIKKYFYEFEGIFDFSWEALLAYVFFNLEAGQRLVLYVGVVKKYQVNTTVAWDAIDGAQINRIRFQEYFKSIFEVGINKSAVSKLDAAAKVRNKVVHGQEVTVAKKREAVGAALQYCELLDAQVFKLVKLHPIGSLQGFPGKMKLLDQATSRLIMKGLGFPLS